MHKGRVHSDKVDKPKPEPGQQADGADKSTQALSPIDSLAAAAAMVQAQAQAQNEFESSPTRASVDMCRMSDAVKGQNKSPSKQDETSAESGADKLLQAAEALHPGNDRVSSEDDTEVPDCPRAPKRKRVDNSGGAEPGSSISEVETEMECDTRTEVTASTMVADGDEGTNEVDEDGNEDEWRSCES